MQQHALCRQAVPTGTPRLLAVLLDALGQAGMHYVAHIGAIDAHAEGHSGDDHIDAF